MWEKDVTFLGRELMNIINNNLNSFGNLPVSYLREIHGIGPARVVAIVVAMELGRRSKIAEMPDIHQIKSP
jgi:DNA repair protein RadC